MLSMCRQFSTFVAYVGSTISPLILQFCFQSPQTSKQIEARVTILNLLIDRRVTDRLRVAPPGKPQMVALLAKTLTVAASHVLAGVALACLQTLFCAVLITDNFGFQLPGFDQSSWAAEALAVVWLLEGYTPKRRIDQHMCLCPR